MRTFLKIPAGEKTKEFLAQLNAKLREISEDWRGTGGRHDDGYVSTVSGEFKLQNKIYELNWSIIQGDDGGLDYVDVECADYNNEDSWRHAAKDFLLEVLAASFSGETRLFVRTILMYYVGPALDGEYWFGSNIRFAPAVDDDKDPGLVNAERVVRFDIKLEAVDVMHSLAIATEIAMAMAARIGLLLHVGMYMQESNMRWTSDREDGQPFISTRRQLGYFGETANISEMPAKGALCNLGRYSGSVFSKNCLVAGERLTLPVETRRFFRALLADPLLSDAFDRCARMMRVSFLCGGISSSVSMAYQVGAIESIAKTCKYHRSFSDFMRDMLGASSDIGGVLDYIYGRVRSGHFHAGDFPAGEFGSRDIFGPAMNFSGWPERLMQYKGMDMIWRAISEWITRIAK